MLKDIIFYIIMVFFNILNIFIVFLYNINNIYKSPYNCKNFLCKLIKIFKTQILIS